MIKLLLLLFIPFVCFGQDDIIDFSSQKSIINYLENRFKATDYSPLEGIWNLGLSQSLVIIKNKDKFIGFKYSSTGSMDSGSSIRMRYIAGDTIAVFEPSNSGSKLFYTEYNYQATVGKKRQIKYRENFLKKRGYKFYSKRNPNNYVDTEYNIYKKIEPEVAIWNPVVSSDRYSRVGSLFLNNLTYTRSFPYSDRGGVSQKINPEKENKEVKIGGWAGNGSGIIISKSGHIVTNHHIIQDIKEVEVEFILNEEVQKFKAEVVQIDKTNDLAILKIEDLNFKGINNLHYNFKTRSSDVGTKVYAYGFPMALSVMGKEIKITDGIISSKSGYGGDITIYQITAPIQGGNSGGPLFDDKGNFIGINSSGLGADVANNVGYTIKSSYVMSLIDVLPKSIDLPSSTILKSLPLTEQIKEISKYVVLIKVK